jgi:pimeloyl-ACP methyl ester carboxylesterase
LYCTALVAAGLVASAATAARQPAPPQPVPGEAVFAVYLGGSQIGREQWTLTRNANGWTIASNGRSAPPLDFTISRFEMKYGTDWQPLEMRLEARVRNQAVVIGTSFTMTTAINEILQNNVTGSKTDQISARTIVLPNNVFASYEVLASRLWDTPAGSELPAYVVPAAEIKIKVVSVTPQTLEGPNGTIKVRRFELSLLSPDRPVAAVAIVDDRLRLVRYEIPSVGLQAVREDVSSVAVRAHAARNPTDADVTIPSNGFNLAGTLTTPPGVAGRLRHPAVLLVGGTSPADRDEIVAGVPVFSQLAQALAESGHIVLRYDRRGAGQSGGRTDSAALGDYTADALAAIKWLGKRNDVDKKRIVIVGHMDGGPVALMAAAATDDIRGVVTIDAAGASGADLILMQQQKLLDDLHLTAADRQARIELQKKIQTAVVRGSGWDGIPEPMRRQADTPWFKSMLTYEPAGVLMKVKQPILILHADLDPSVPPSEADKLGDLAKARKKSPPVEVIHLPDLDHALATTAVRSVSPKAPEAIAAWIKKL